MSLFTESMLIERARQEAKSYNRYLTYDFQFREKSKEILTESRTDQKVNHNRTYDIFLSHSSNDVEKVLGLKLIIEDLGYSVYIDWIEDPQLDRSKVNKETAELLRFRMKRCSCLVYAFSTNSSQSKWMPWELGYFDAYNGKVAVLPISGQSYADFSGTEYLGLYYYIEIDTIKNSSKYALWLHENKSSYINFRFWLNDNSKPYKRS